jgi:SPP1 gp7 family putative phage head morphogenesis protein
MPSQLETAVNEFRAAALRLDAGAATQMVSAYNTVAASLDHDIQAMAQRIQSARESGIDTNPSWLAQDTRFRTLRAQVESQLEHFSTAAGEIVRPAQKQAIELAASKIIDLARRAAGPAPASIALPWDRLPSDAMLDLVGVSGDGAPLGNLLRELPGQGGQALHDALLEGLATGKAPREMVRGIRAELAGTEVRALRIQRTETFRALRGASSREYERNKDVLEGWIWSCAPSDKTCAMCYAMDGTLHDAGETMDTHPSCRCAQAPRTKSWADLGFDIPDRRPALDGPGEKFDRLSDAGKLNVLGPGKYAALQDGRIELSDLVERTHSEQWGPGRRERSLADALA